MDSCLFALCWCRNRWHQVWTGQILWAWTMQLLIYTVWANMSCLCSRPGMPSRVEWRWENQLWLPPKAVQEIRSWNKVGIIENERHFAKASAEATKILNVPKCIYVFPQPLSRSQHVMHMKNAHPANFSIANFSSLGNIPSIDLPRNGFCGSVPL